MPFAVARAFLIFALCTSVFSMTSPPLALAQEKTTDGDTPAKKRKPIEERLPGILSGQSTGIDLSKWKVTLPVNEDGVSSGEGDAVELKKPTGFSVPPYFDVQQNSITFMAPTDGARTKGSNYPRSELREMDGKGREYEWLVGDGGRLSATLKVNELPVADDELPSRIVIGQIHGPDDELCRLYYTDSGELYFIDDKAGDDHEETVFKLISADGTEPKIPLGATFSYVIDANSERLSVTVSYNGVDYVGVNPISSFWPDKPLYFKAGSYVQIGKTGSKARTVGQGRGSATFTAISTPTHDIYREQSEEEQKTVESEGTSSERRSGKVVSNVELYAGCIAVKTAKLLEDSGALPDAREKARPLCASLNREFSANEIGEVNALVDKIFAR
ncbi:polysaccharide lyase family 7 protein [Agrobacterium sp. SUL3]|uniref:polysaccharide lyase family 7 protein n=1 Tax=Agrobacterium sp. SUL3 TaxID=1701910 RepID=UPI00069C283C|nr:polysaccharide lyase family 7 protein [Agrobacterium sp. SUL3]